MFPPFSVVLRNGVKWPIRKCFYHQEAQQWNTLRDGLVLLSYTSPKKKIYRDILRKRPIQDLVIMHENASLNLTICFQENSSKLSFVFPTDSWRDLFESVISVGIPELQDQMSGAMYMNMNPNQEAACTKALRLASEVAEMNDSDVAQTALYLEEWGPLRLMESLAIQTIMDATDQKLCQTLNSRVIQDLFCISASLCELRAVRDIKFIREVESLGLKTVKPTESDYELAIVLLLLSSTSSQPKGSTKDFSNAVAQCIEAQMKKQCEKNELAVALAGLRVLDSANPIIVEIEEFVKKSYGFRL